MTEPETFADIANSRTLHTARSLTGYSERAIIQSFRQAAAMQGGWDKGFSMSDLLLALNTLTGGGWVLDSGACHTDAGEAITVEQYLRTVPYRVKFCSAIAVQTERGEHALAVIDGCLKDTASPGFVRADHRVTACIHPR